MLPERKYDEWSQKDHKDREYQSSVEEKFFGAVENPKAAPQELKDLYRDYARYLSPQKG